MGYIDSFRELTKEQKIKEKQVQDINNEIGGVSLDWNKTIQLLDKRNNLALKLELINRKLKNLKTTKVAQGVKGTFEIPMGFGNSD